MLNSPDMPLPASTRDLLRAALQANPSWEDYKTALGLKVATMSKAEYIAAANVLDIDISKLTSQETTTGTETEGAYMYSRDDVTALKTLFYATMERATDKQRALVEGILHTIETRQAGEATAKQYATVSSIVRQAEAKKNDAKSGFGDFANATREHVKDSATTATTATVRATPKTDDPVANALEVLKGALSNPINPETLRDMVKDAVDRAMADHPTIRIELTAQGEVKGSSEGHAHPMFVTLCKVLSARTADGFAPNVWIAGPAGSGKSYACKEFAKAAGVGYYFHGAMNDEFQVLGHEDGNGRYHRTPFRDAFEHGGVVVFEEVDSWGPSATLALNSATANGACCFPDGIVKRHPMCIIIACANTWGGGATADYVGRAKLDAAFIDRFGVRLAWDYDTALEVAICGNPAFARRVQAARERARAKGLKVIISPRASITGSALIAQGMTPDEVANLTYLANLTADQRKMVEGV